MTRRDRAVRAVYRVGWWGATHIPAAVLRPLIWTGAAVAARTHGRPLRELRHNLTVAAGRPADDRLVAAALRSYLRTLTEVLSLPRWRPDQIVGRVQVPDAARLRRRQAESGAVVVLPHSGNWDLAGAWACLSGFPVTSVVEVLNGAAYGDFLRFRRRLGMEVVGHTDPAVMSTLTAAVRGGRTVCLIGDRDLSGTGVEVRWAGHQVRMPAGPALLARRTGAALIPGVCRFTAAGMVIDLGPEVTHQSGSDGLAAMTQQVADFFAARIRDQPQDWPMLQPFFAARRARSS
ncbi:MAG: phosphatidylinositol mannoside acyltransferase [Microlunatus sp.]|nr:phosphatidylinositol mannoside acyltransferase [Microlunatus sp.]MDN5770637.1 phosphatidylinositol mannoside acyltransferase [Microlunatus sp.]MDN5803212.1 phosphatidylinositol mannoside acyltransferase [Microlunatus sp.]